MKTVINAVAFALAINTGSHAYLFNNWNNRSSLMQSSMNVEEDLLLFDLDEKRNEFLPPAESIQTTLQTIQRFKNFAFYYVRHWLEAMIELALLKPTLWEKVQFPDDSLKDFHQICEKYGFKSEKHMVVTKDGYINAIFRVYKEDLQSKQQKLKNQTTSNKPVIIMMHGVIDSSDIWALNEGGKSPAFIAASAGYDVWLTNSRGNKYSYQHVSFDSRYDKQYWDHSFAEISKYDVPAFIDFVRKQTNMSKDQKVTLIAHSQGTTEVVYGFAKDPDYYSKNVNSFVAIAPVTKLTKVAPLNQMVMWTVQNFSPMFEFFGIFDLFNYQIFHYPLFMLCGFWTDACWISTAFIASKTALPINYDKLKVLMAHYPSGSGFKCFKHYMQILRAHRFQEFDYGNIMNLRLYGQTTAPEINLNPINDLGIPIVIVYGKDDTIVYQEDSLWLYEQIKRSIVDLIQTEGGHVHFFIGNNADWMMRAMESILLYNPLDQSAAHASNVLDSQID